MNERGLNSDLGRHADSWVMLFVPVYKLNGKSAASKLGKRFVVFLYLDLEGHKNYTNREFFINERLYYLHLSHLRIYLFDYLFIYSFIRSFWNIIFLL